MNKHRTLNIEHRTLRIHLTMVGQSCRFALISAMASETMPAHLGKNIASLIFYSEGHSSVTFANAQKTFTLNPPFR